MPANESTQASAAALTEGTYVRFMENAATPADGFVSRVWANGKYVTIKTDEAAPRTFTRLVGAVTRGWPAAQ